MSPPACPTQSDALWMLSPAQCSGHGRCVDARNFSAHFASLCVCDEGWSGGTDMFDLRVARDDRGQVLALACPNPVVAVTVVWAVLLAVAVHRELTLVYALVQRCRVRGRPTSFAKFWGYTPYRVLVLDSVLYNPWYIITAVCKVFFNQVVGTDNLISWSLILAVSLMSVSAADFRISQFTTFAGARTLNSDKTNRLVRIFTATQWGMVLLYVVLAGIPTLYALLFDNSLGPIGNFEFVTLVIRNFGIVCWAGSQWFGTTKILRELRYLLEITKNAGDGANGGTSQTSKVLAFTQGLFKEMSQQFVIGMVGYILFSLPWLWCYQSFSIGFFLILPALKNNAGRTLLATTRAAKRGSTIEQRLARGSIDENTGDNTDGSRPSASAKRGPANAKKRGSSVVGGGTGSSASTKDRANSADSPVGQQHGHLSPGSAPPGKEDKALQAAMAAAREAVDRELKAKEEEAAAAAAVAAAAAKEGAEEEPSSSASASAAVTWVPHLSTGKGALTVMQKNPMFEGVDNSSSTDLHMVTGSFKELDSAQVVPLTEEGVPSS